MISYLHGDATDPIGPNPKAIVHIVNDMGAFGSGFAYALLAKWRTVEQQYRAWHRSKVHFELGQVQYVEVEEGITVCSMMAQHGFGRQLTPPIRYEALRECLEAVNGRFPPETTIHGPRLGAGLAGGSWAKVEEILNETMPRRSVTIYDRPGGTGGAGGIGGYNP